MKPMFVKQQKNAKIDVEIRNFKRIIDYVISHSLILFLSLILYLILILAKIRCKVKHPIFIILY